MSKNETKKRERQIGQYKIQTGDWVQMQTRDWRLQTRYKTHTEVKDCLFVKYVITCHFITYQVSRNPFSAVIFNKNLYYGNYTWVIFSYNVKDEQKREKLLSWLMRDTYINVH